VQQVTVRVVRFVKEQTGAAWAGVKRKKLGSREQSFPDS